MYSHGIATLALCEALAMTRDEYRQPETATPRWGDPTAASNAAGEAASDRLRRDTGGDRSGTDGSDANLLGYEFDATAPVTLPELTRAAQASGDVYRTGSTSRRRLAVRAASGGRHVGRWLATDGAQKRLLGGTGCGCEGRGAGHAILGLRGRRPRRVLLRLHPRGTNGLTWTSTRGSPRRRRSDCCAGCTPAGSTNGPDWPTAWNG